MRRSAFLASLLGTSLLGTSLLGTSLLGSSLLGTSLLLSGCVGFDDFLSDTITTKSNPNRPLGDSMNMRRVQGLAAAADPVVVEPGNVWPRGVERMPTLQDLESGGTVRLPDQPRMPRARGAQGSSGAQGLSDTQGAPTALADTPSARDAGLALPDLAQPPPASGRYQTVNTPSGTEVLAPNGDGTSTLMHSDGTTETVPARR